MRDIFPKRKRKKKNEEKSRVKQRTKKHLNNLAKLFSTAFHIETKRERKKNGNSKETKTKESTNDIIANNEMTIISATILCSLFTLLYEKLVSDVNVMYRI